MKTPGQVKKVLQLEPETENGQNTYTEQIKISGVNGESYMAQSDKTIPKNR